MKGILKRVRWVILIMAGLYLIWIVAKENHSSKNFSMPVHDTIPGEYQDIFVRSNMGKLVNKDSYFSKVGRDPISQFDFDDRYHAIVTKIKTENGITLREMIQEVYRRSKITSQVMYEDIGLPYKLSFQIDEPAKSYSKLYLSLNGDSIKTIVKNDTIAAYTLKMKDFAIQYQKDGLVDMIGETKNHSDKIPVMLVFKKIKAATYFLFISSNDQDGKLEPNLLKELLN